LADHVRTHPDICGLATSQETAPVFGQAFIGRPIPLYVTAAQPGLARLMPYINALGLLESEAAPAGYRRSGCWEDGYRDTMGKRPAPKVCLYRRTGACAAGAPMPTSNSPPSALSWPPSALQFRRFAVSPP